MARKPRLVVPGLPLHVVQRGHDRKPCFFQSRDYGTYLHFLRECSHVAGCQVHAYVLMTNHVHLLLTPPERDAASLLLKSLGQRYTGYVNHVYARSGTLWEGRFRSSVVDTDAYFVACQRYIELNPVRAGMVPAPGDYPWSSYRANATGLPRGGLLVPHPSYLALGDTPTLRAKAYGRLFGAELSPATLHRIRDATRRNHIVGDAGFHARVARLVTADPGNTLSGV